MNPKFFWENLNYVNITKQMHYTDVLKQYTLAPFNQLWKVVIIIWAQLNKSIYTQSELIYTIELIELFKHKRRTVEMWWLQFELIRSHEIVFYVTGFYINYICFILFIYVGYTVNDVWLGVYVYTHLITFISN